MLGLLDFGHDSETVTVVPRGLCEAIGSKFERSKASGCDQSVHKKFSLLGRDILLATKNEFGSNAMLNISIDVYHVEHVRVDAENEAQNRNTKIRGLCGLTLTTYVYVGNL